MKMEILYQNDDGQWIDFEKVIKDSHEKIQMKLNIKQILKEYYKNENIEQSKIIKITSFYENYLKYHACYCTCS